jgi:hypothetical protein
MVTLADVQAQVFTPHCLSVGCHTAAKPDGNMVLEAGSAFAALVDVPAFNFAAMNAGLVRVSPGDPDASFLLIKLTGPTIPQGSLMPMGQPPLSAELIALVRAWIPRCESVIRSYRKMWIRYPRVLVGWVGFDAVADAVEHPG